MLHITIYDINRLVKYIVIKIFNFFLLSSNFKQDTIKYILIRMAEKKELDVKQLFIYLLFHAWI